MRRPFLTLLRSRRGSCPQKLLILHSLRSAHTESAKFAPCFQSLAQSFSLFAKRRNAISIPFNHFHTLCKSAGGRPPPRQNTPISPRRLGRRRVPTERPNTDQASELVLVAARRFVTSLLRPFTRRNLISRLIILWRRDTEPILVAWVYTPVRGFVFDALACNGSRVSGLVLANPELE